MIPKKIHYCWFGGNPLPPLAKKCIASWNKFLPDYDIIEWNEKNFDINAIKYTAEAYAAKKYAFVSDYARFQILHDEGGLYFDTDVEIIRPIDDVIARGAFMGVEMQNRNTITVAPGLGIGAEPHHPLIKEMISYYSKLSFLTSNGDIIYTNIVEHTSSLLMNYGLQNVNGIQKCANLTIYPKDYFCPIDYETRELKITSNTRTIHHYAESWVPLSTKLKNKMGRLLGKGFMEILVSLKNKVRNA